MSRSKVFALASQGTIAGPTDGSVAGVWFRRGSAEAGVGLCSGGGWPAHNGVMATLLALKGLTGPASLHKALMPPLPE